MSSPLSFIGPAISLAGGGKGGGKGGGGGPSGGVDYAAIQQAVGQNQQMIANRYSQLGLGVPSGSGAAAAASGTSLTSAGPSTMQQMDEQFAAEQGQALAGQLQSQFPGNQNFGGDLGQLASNAGFNAGQTSGDSSSQPDAFGVPPTTGT